ncbi:hypothetical protein Clacol_002068 [Clathrus columnatus]|uniref:Fatty acid hydroxylase domain-containing protein n=1 Tax=Clathrus columnatus TaxID=1419009 RepID=A0AAV4ZZQ3_9AGAM|nr:hypothetical protein Clacol_002068 [Clathrus columnatus]
MKNQILSGYSDRCALSPPGSRDPLCAYKARFQFSMSSHALPFVHIESPPFFSNNITQLYPPSFSSGNISYPWYYTHRDNIFPNVSDKLASLLGNVLSYWITSSFYYTLDISNWKWVERYRLQESEEAKAKNLVSKLEVLRIVVLQQLMQTVFGYVWMTFIDAPSFPSSSSSPSSLPISDHVAGLWSVYKFVERVCFSIFGTQQYGQHLCMTYGVSLTYTIYWWIIPIIQMLLAFFILDTYEYFLHRTFHEIKFLYKHFHSIHHRLHAPYAFGAMYGHPFESAVLDGLGATLAHTLVGLTDRQAILFFALASYKTVDDHCGYNFPWHPVHRFFGNSAEYHDIHHQRAGIKSNYSQPVFIHWDVIMGTRMTKAELLAKKDRAKVHTQKME